ncbi:MAG: hypothetical protein WD876_03440 [Candidatus Pacearchaeota archaeon]
MKTKKILFVCKYNRFRSQIAESYFRKINKNKSIEVSSAGIIRGWFPLDKDEVRVAKKIGIEIKKKPETLSTELLRKTDIVVVVANDISTKIFEGVYISPESKKKFNTMNKLLVWKIPDVEAEDGDEKIGKIIKIIMINVEKLVKNLEKRK